MALRGSASAKEGDPWTENEETFPKDSPEESVKKFLSGCLHPLRIRTEGGSLSSGKGFSLPGSLPQMRRKNEH
jgi:hypothetical protein